jgi:hypothetical protein
MYCLHLEVLLASCLLGLIFLTSEEWMIFNQTTLHYLPEDSTLHRAVGGTSNPTVCVINSALLSYITTLQCATNPSKIQTLPTHSKSANFSLHIMSLGKEERNTFFLVFDGQEGQATGPPRQTSNATCSNMGFELQFLCPQDIQEQCCYKTLIINLNFHAPHIVLDIYLHICLHCSNFSTNQ